MHSYLPPRQVSLNLTKCSGARDLTLSFSKSLGNALGVANGPYWLLRIS
jgi:hypothetical protein